MKKKAMETRLIVRPLVGCLTHTHFWEGPCRAGNPADMTSEKENAAAVSVKGKNPGRDRFEFRWVDRREEPFSPTRTCRRSHADPTADAAISNIIREEKRRKRAKARRGKRPG